MEPDTIIIRGGYSKEDLVTLFLKFISLADEQEYMKKFTESADAIDKDEKHYQLIVDALAKWSTQMPLGPDGKPMTADTPADAVRARFNGRSIKNERLANSLMIDYRRQMNPTIDFPQPSASS